MKNLFSCNGFSLWWFADMYVLGVCKTEQWNPGNFLSLKFVCSDMSISDAFFNSSQPWNFEILSDLTEKGLWITSIESYFKEQQLQVTAVFCLLSYMSSFYLYSTRATILLQDGSRIPCCVWWWEQVFQIQMYVWRLWQCLVKYEYIFRVKLC